MTAAVPPGLRTWFVVHCVADVVTAIPLFVAPTAMLTWLGWSTVDPIATRLVAAALFGIGLESYLGRNAGPEAMRGMLNLKIIWSAAAVIGGVWGQVTGGPAAGWAIVAIFFAFNLLWTYFRVRLQARPAAA